MDIRLSQNLTLADLVAGDRPGMPKRESPGEVKWYNISSVAANNIAYKDFQVRKGEMYIGVNNRVFIANSSGIRLGHEEWEDAPFKVNMQGEAIMTQADITGKITAESGVIGGFTITPTQMYGGIIKTAIDTGAGSPGVIMDTAGLRGYDANLGEVFNLPTDGSSPSFSSGTISNTVFEINTNAILRTSETVGDGTASSAGVLVNNTGIYACAASQTLANANVKILATGEAVFSGSVKGGMTDFMTGAGYFMGLSSGAYKLSVGDPDGDYMSWDGGQLRIKGVVELDGPLNLEGYATVDLPIAPTSAGYNFPGAYE